ncbi:MAG: hypothetical protein QW609_02760 [Candidatus Aenigmatarchaeota archaeon]
MGTEPSAYVPTAPMILTEYNFSHWENGETALTRYIDINENMTITAYYTTGPPLLPGIFGNLMDKGNNPLDANISILQEKTDIIVNSTLTQNGVYDLSVSPGRYDVEYKILTIQNFYVKIISINLSSRIKDLINYVTQYSNKILFTATINENK